MAPTESTWAGAQPAVDDSDGPGPLLRRDWWRASVYPRIEDFDSIPVGTLSVSSGILNGTGATGTGTWNVVAGRMISGVNHSEINITSSSVFRRDLVFDHTYGATVIATMSMNVVPTSTTVLLSTILASAANVTAQVCITTTGLFQMRNVNVAEGGTIPFRPGRLHQLVWYVDTAAQTQTLNVYDENAVLIGTASATVTGTPNRGYNRLQFGTVTAPGVAARLWYDRVGVIPGTGVATHLTAPISLGKYPRWTYSPRPPTDGPPDQPLRDYSDWWPVKGDEASASPDATVTTTAHGARAAGSDVAVSTGSSPDVTVTTTGHAARASATAATVSAGATTTQTGHGARASGTASAATAGATVLPSPHGARASGTQATVSAAASVTPTPHAARASGTTATTSAGATVTPTPHAARAVGTQVTITTGATITVTGFGARASGSPVTVSTTAGVTITPTGHTARAAGTTATVAAGATVLPKPHAARATGSPATVTAGATVTLTTHGARGAGTACTVSAGAAVTTKAHTARAAGTAAIISAATPTNLTLTAHQPLGRRVATLPSTRRQADQPTSARRTSTQALTRRQADQPTLGRRTGKEPTQ